MARPVWSGSLTFGLVSLPVGIYTATESHTFHFHQLERGTSDRVRNRRVNERTGEEVALDDIVKGFDTGGEYVLVERQELADVAPGRSKALEITGFVELDEIARGRGPGPLHHDARRADRGPRRLKRPAAGPPLPRHGRVHDQARARGSARRDSPTAGPTDDRRRSTEGSRREEADRTKPDTR